MAEENYYFYDGFGNPTDVHGYPIDQPVESSELSDHPYGKEEEFNTPVQQGSIDNGIGQHNFYEVGVHDTDTKVSTEFLLDLMSKPDEVRNVALVGPPKNGKTFFMDMLVEQTHHMLTYNGIEHTRYTDTRVDEQKEGMSIKTIPMSLVLNDSNSRSYVCNIMDTPGRPEFSDEVTAALRLADGVVLIVDAAEGVLVNTKRVIRHAIQDQLPIVVVINKMDRLITELKLAPKDAYHKLRLILEAINCYIHDAGDDQVIDPVAGNVCFASATAGWSFTLQTFSQQYVNRHGLPLRSSEFAAHLWGDMYYHHDTKEFKKKPPAGGGKVSFVEIVLEPLFQLYILTGRKMGVAMGVATTLAELGVTLRDIDYELSGKHLLRKACSSVFGAATGFTDMLVQYVPSAIEGGRRKLHHTCIGSKRSEKFKEMVKCSRLGPLMVNVAKFYPKFDGSICYGLGRVYSGVLLTGSKVGVKEDCELSGVEEGMPIVGVKNLWVYQGRYKIPIDRAIPGYWVLIEGVDDCMKSATLCSLKINEIDESELFIFRPLLFNILPILKITIEPRESLDWPQMVKAMQKISKSYPLAIIKVEDSGEHTILGTGSLHLRRIVKDIEELYFRKQLQVSDPVASFCETVVDRKGIAEAPNRTNKMTMIAEPLLQRFVEDIENGVVSIDLPEKKLRKFCQKYGTDLLATRPIWAVGPDKQGPNILLGDTLQSEADMNLLCAAKDSIVHGFQMAAWKGPLCHEPIREVMFKITAENIDIEVFRGEPGNIRSTARAAACSAFLRASPRLMEPVCHVEIITPGCWLPAICKLLLCKRGYVKAEVAQEWTPAYIVEAYLPVTESFKFEAHLKFHSEQQASSSLVFDHWAIVPGDPLENSTVLQPGQNLAREYMMETRRRKGMREDVSMNEHL